MAMSFPFRADRTGRTAEATDEAALVSELVEMVLFTAPGERVMRPTLGTGIHQLVFAPASDELATATQHMVKAALQQWLSDWIEVGEVNVRSDDATLYVTVSWVLRSTREQQRTTFRRTL